MQAAVLAPKPVVPFLRIPDAEQPYLEALGCQRCGKLFLDARRHCSACGARDALAPRRLQQSGTLYAYTVVHRSLPGVKVPYVSAVVDLDGGGTVKGNLQGIAPDPRVIAVGLRVRLGYALVEGTDAATASGRPPILSYFFVPEESKS